MFDGAKPLTMAISALAGYLAGGAVRDSGLSVLLYKNVPKYRETIDTLESSGIRTGYPGGWGTVAKGAGLASLVDVMYHARKSGSITGGRLNVELPLAVGLLADPPGESSTLGSSSQGYWSS